MLLSRLILNPRSRQAQREIANPYEMHRTIMRAFPAEISEHERILFRLKIHSQTGIPTLLVQSKGKPDWGWLRMPESNYLLSEDALPLEVDNPSVKEVTLNLRQGQVLTFRLRANPTTKKDRPDKKQGRRVGVYSEDEQRKWLQRKLENAGAQLIDARTVDLEKIKGRLKRETTSHELSFACVQFEGILQVKDSSLLVQAVESGIGSGKGLGFGLLSLAPARH